MKSTLFFLLLFLHSLTSCKKEDPCAGVFCRNGGTCINGLCDCIGRFEGPDCTTLKLPNSIVIRAINITKYPTRRPDGTNWDPFGHPDPYIVLTQDNNTIYRSPIKEEHAPNTPLAYFFSLKIEDLRNAVIISLYDDDGLFSPELMARSFFTLWTNDPSLPVTILSSSNTDFSAEMIIEYDY